MLEKETIHKQQSEEKVEEETVRGGKGKLIEQLISPCQYLYLLSFPLSLSLYLSIYISIYLSTYLRVIGC